jgi:drug/metabolite transporter (DMT)-like permease
MAPIIVKAVTSVLLRKARKSVTAWIGAAVAATGGAAVISPELLEQIPEGLRGYAIAVVGVAVVLARHRAEITALYGDLKAAVRKPRKR